MNLNDFFYLLTIAVALFGLFSLAILVLNQDAIVKDIERHKQEKLMKRVESKYNRGGLRL